MHGEKRNGGGDGERDEARGRTAPAAEIPAENLPEEFVRRLEGKGEEGAGEAKDAPAEPRPAATAVLLRDGGTRGAPRVEVLLVRRSRSAGFVPGAYVFPGGRVDPADGAPEALDRLAGTTPAELARRLGLEEGGTPSAAAYLVAAFRETFEETGLLPGTPADAEPPDATLRDQLLRDEIPFHEVLARMDATLDAGEAAYIAHWVTPEAEPRRYDTRFFALRVEAGPPVRMHAGEIVAALWTTPAEALVRHEDGDLPMVFPTVHTLEGLDGFRDTSEALAHLRALDVPRIQPRLVRTRTGVGIEMPDLP